MSHFRKVYFLTAAVMLGACTTLPEGPSVMVLPGTGKSFEQFRADDALCRQYAFDAAGGRTANQAAIDAGVRSAAVGTLVGAAAGAALDGSRGAAVGAGTGLLVGGMAGSGAAHSSSYAAQRSYDHTYIQCMYAKGHRVPVSGRLMDGERPAAPPPPPPPGSPPPPPPGSPPPPPPGVTR